MVQSIPMFGSVSSSALSSTKRPQPEGTPGSLAPTFGSDQVTFGASKGPGKRLKGITAVDDSTDAFWTEYETHMKSWQPRQLNVNTPAEFDATTNRLIRELQVGQYLTIGRLDTYPSDIQIPQHIGGISRKHAEITRTDSGLKIRDLDSAYGTFISGKDVTGTQKLPKYAWVPLIPSDTVLLNGPTSEWRFTVSR